MACLQTLPGAPLRAHPDAAGLCCACWLIDGGVVAGYDNGDACLFSLRNPRRPSLVLQVASIGPPVMNRTDGAVDGAVDGGADGAVDGAVGGAAVDAHVVTAEAPASAPAGESGD